MSKRKTVLHYRTSKNGTKPSATNLNYGEIALNYASGDEKLFIKNTDDEIITFKSSNIEEPLDTETPKLYWYGTLPVTKDEGALKGILTYKSSTIEETWYATLKVQGDSSTKYPKKNFTITLYTDDTYSKKSKTQFKDWNKSNSYVMKAHWIDHSHVRNISCAQLWSEIMETRDDFSSLPEELQSADGHGATKGFSFRFWANGLYYGLYEMILPKKTIFGQDKDNANHSLLNSDYNNLEVCAFNDLNPVLSKGWTEELQDAIPASANTSFCELIKLIARNDIDEIKENIDKYVDVQTVIDYDIFARVFCVVDNLCKNQIFATYDGTKWYEGAWDMDATVGNHPTGGSFFDYNTEFQTGYVAYKDYGIENMLYTRVEHIFLERFKERYTSLRNTVLNVNHIINVFELNNDRVAEWLAEDVAETTGDGTFITIPNQKVNNIQQIRSFLAKRLAYMDEIINNLGFKVAAPSIETSVNIATITCETEGASIYYTLDGTEPTEASTEYTEPFEFTDNTVCKAIAMKANYEDSDVVTQTLAWEKVATPTIEISANIATITCETEGVSIYYTLDGSEPSETSTAYTEPFAFANNVDCKVIAIKTNYNNSDVLSQTLEWEKVAKPSITTDESTATIACATEGASIYYTLDGTEPSETSTLYENPFEFEDNVVCKAVAMKANYNNSDVITETLTSSPYIEIDYVIQSGKSPFMTDYIPNANTEVEYKIKYDINTVGKNYGGTHFLSDYETLTFASPLLRYRSSSIGWQIFSKLGSSTEYITTIDAPDFTVPHVLAVKDNAITFDGTKLFDVTVSGTFNYPFAMFTYAQQGVLQTSSYAMENAALYYCKIWESGVLVREYVPAYCKTDGLFGVYEKVNNNFYTGLNGFIYDGEAKIVSNPVTTCIDSTATLTCATEGASIYYTLDGTDPTTSSTLYTTPFEFTDGTVCKAVAMKTDYIQSPIISTTLEKASSQYTELESVTQNGKATFLTDYIPNSNTELDYKLKYDADDAVEYYSGHHFLSVVDTTNGKSQFFAPLFRRLTAETGKQIFATVGGSEEYLSTFSDMPDFSIPYVVSVKDNAITMNGTKLFDVTMDADTITKPFAMFSYNNDGTLITKDFVLGNATFYYLTISERGTVVREYIPAQKSDGTYGIYEKYTGTFYTGTNGFIA